MKNLILSTVLLAPLAANAAMNTQQEKGSYAFGYKLGSALLHQGQKMDVSSFETGFAAGMNGKQSELSPKEEKSALSYMQAQAMQNFQKKFKAQSASNAKAGNAFLARNAKKAGVKTLSSGLQYKILTQGSGPKAKANGIVTVNYEGRLLNGKVFDSSYKRGQPVTLNLKAVIKGWQIAIPKMKQGATWMLYIPSDLAYGKTGVPGMIGPDSTLIFKVQLVKVH